jgi:hypothetical protein
MLSESCNILEFLDKVKCNNYHRVLTLADREATDVERSLIKSHHDTVKSGKRQEYAATLKDIITFMRYGIKTRKVRVLNLEFLYELRRT